MSKKEMTVNGHNVNLYEFAKCEKFFELLNEAREIALEIKHKCTNWVEEDISTVELIDFVESKRERAHEVTIMLEDLSFELSGILREDYDIHVAVNQIKTLLDK